MKNLKTNIMKAKFELTVEKQNEKGYRFLNHNTKEQRDQYYESVISFYKRRIENEIEVCEKKCEETKDVQSRGHYSNVQSLEYALKGRENMNIKTLGWLRDAEMEFDAKLNKVALKLVSFGFCIHTSSMKVSVVENNHSRGLDFYITAESYVESETEMKFGSPKKEYFNLGRAYARLIWVDCYEKASHWRFICTLKK
jgi:hypothetical protein